MPIEPYLSNSMYKSFLTMAFAIRSPMQWRLSIRVELNLLFYVTINDISVIYVTAHRCAGGLKKKLDLRSGSQRHRHFVGFLRGRLKCYYSCIIACFSDVGLPSLFVTALSNISCFCQVECTFSNISTC